MVSNGLTYTFLSDMLKGLFVEVAEGDFPLAGKAPSDSRISMLTGVHRGDIRRLRHGGAKEDLTVSGPVSLGAQIVAAWLTQALFMDAEGKPLSLARLSSHSSGPSFEDLVASQSKDVRARVVLDEWLRLGIARIDDGDMVSLVTESFVPQAGFEEKLQFFAHNLADHAAAAGANLEGDGPPWLERSVFFDELSPASVELLHTRARQSGDELLKALGRSAADLEKSDVPAPDVRRRFTCGIYFYSAPVAKGEAD